MLFHVLIFQCFSPDPLPPQISLVNAASDLFPYSQQSHRQETREKQVTTLKSTELYFAFPEEGWKNEMLDNNNSYHVLSTYHELVHSLFFPPFTLPFPSFSPSLSLSFHLSFSIYKQVLHSRHGTTDVTVKEIV